MTSVQVERFHRRVTNLQSHHEYASRRHLTANQNYVNSNRTLMDSLISHLSEGDKKCKKAKRLSKPRTTNSHVRFCSPNRYSLQVSKLSRYGEAGSSLLALSTRNMSGTICPDEISGGNIYAPPINPHTGNVERMFDSNLLNQQYLTTAEPIFPPAVFGEPNFMAESVLNQHVSPDTDTWTMYDRHSFDIPHYENIATDYAISGYSAPSFYCSNGVPNLCRPAIFSHDVDKPSHLTNNAHTSLPERSAFHSKYNSYWYRHPEVGADTGLQPSLQSRHEHHQAGMRDMRSAGKSSHQSNFFPPNQDLPVFPHLTSPSSSLAGINPILVSTYVSVPNNSRLGSKVPTSFRKDVCQVPNTTGYGYLPVDPPIAMSPNPFDHI